MTNYINKITAALTAAHTPATTTPKAPVTTGINFAALQKKASAAGLITVKPAPAQPAKPAQPKTPVATTTTTTQTAPTTTLPSDGHVAVSLNNKVVKLDFNKAGSATQTVELETTNWFVAAIMNIFAKIFPSISYGASQFKINNETVYVRNSTMFEKLIHGGISRTTFGKDAATNAISLEMHAKTHFSH